MLKKLGGYFLGVTIITFLLFLFHAAVPSFYPAYHLTKGYALILIFAFLFLFLHGVIFAFTKGRPEWLAQMFLVQTTLKMLILLSLFLLLSRMYPQEKFSLMALFFFAYLSFTLHDLFWLLRFVKKNASAK